MNYDVLKGSEANVEIDTPNVAIHPQMNIEGSYRILVNSDGETIVDVRKGSAEISTPQGSTQVEKDQRITIQGNADNAQYQVAAAPARMNGTSGTATAITSSRVRKAGSTPIPTTRAARILTGTEIGATFLIMEQCGFPPRDQAGHRTAMAAGFLNPTTGGPGFPMNPGAGRHITMAGGSSMAGTGAGGPGQSTADIVRFGRPLTSRSSALAVEDGESDWGSGSAAASAILAGCRVAQAIGSFPGMAAA